MNIIFECRDENGTQLSVIDTSKYNKKGFFETLLALLYTYGDKRDIEKAEEMQIIGSKAKLYDEIVKLNGGGENGD